ncbi:unnamed protein product [Sympodiomycopsis kandeliae]
MPRRKPIGEKPATRSSRTKLLDDPDQRERELNAQLKSMSLYASQTSGDGNCLFRALSDQFYGHPEHHARLRQEICEYLAASPDRFAGFVDIEKSFDEYVKTMRQNGTYGGHLELSAFASLKKKEIKIVQPGLVYVVSGDDDSSERIAERQALERVRQRIQDSIPPGSEGPPPKNRELRRKKRAQSSRLGSLEAGSSRATTEEPMNVTSSDPKLVAGSHDASSSALTGEAEAEAYGPLYIAYHNWEHYSSVRNVSGPHSGLPRIIERNVSLAAQPTSSSPKGKARQSIGEESEVTKPTEHEELILRSVPGHTLSEVRFLLKQHGNLWESVVEVLIAQDAATDSGQAKHPAIGSSPPGAMTRSRAPSHTYGSTSSPRPHHQLQHSSMSNGTIPHSPSSQSQYPLAVPEHLRGARNAWRGASPSASSSGGDANSASGHAGGSTPASREDALASGIRHGDPGDIPETFGPAAEERTNHRQSKGSFAIGVKRAASKDLMPPDGDGRSPKRRSSSREREREERLVDGALASRFDAAASTLGDAESPHPRPNAGGQTPESAYSGSGSGSGSTRFQVPSTSVSTPAADSISAHDSPITDDLADADASQSTAVPLDLDDEDLASYYSSRRRILSPPLTSDAIANLRSEAPSMSPKEKREWELKRKRDRQRERRAAARSSKGSKGSKPNGKIAAIEDKRVTKIKGKGGSGSEYAASSKASSSRSAVAARQRRDQRIREEDDVRETNDGPKGFVELKI